MTGVIQDAVRGPFWKKILIPNERWLLCLYLSVRSGPWAAPMQLPDLTMWAPWDTTILNLLRGTQSRAQQETSRKGADRL
jgi:hypothetical protein